MNNFPEYTRAQEKAMDQPHWLEAVNPDPLELGAEVRAFIDDEEAYDCALWGVMERGGLMVDTQLWACVCVGDKQVELNFIADDVKRALYLNVNGCISETYTVTPMPATQRAQCDRRDARRFSEEPQPLTDWGNLT